MLVISLIIVITGTPLPGEDDVNPTSNSVNSVSVDMVRSCETTTSRLSQRQTILLSAGITVCGPGVHNDVRICSACWAIMVSTTIK